DFLRQLYHQPQLCLLHLGRDRVAQLGAGEAALWADRSEEHTSELQSHRDLPSFPTRRSPDLTSCATSPTSRSFASCIWGEIGLPNSVLAKPHCGLTDRKSTRLNSSPTEISPLFLHDALPI